MKPHMLKTGTNTRMKTKGDKKPNQKKKRRQPNTKEKGANRKKKNL
jgi:hypothetical protein